MKKNAIPGATSRYIICISLGIEVVVQLVTSSKQKLYPVSHDGDTPSPSSPAYHALLYS